MPPDSEPVDRAPATDPAGPLPGFTSFFDYRVDILRRRNRVVATLDGIVLAESRRTLVIDEQSHGLVIYFPYTDVAWAELAPIPGRSTRCPFKGEASYWARKGTGKPIAWAYADPLAQVSQLRDHLAFDQDLVVVTLGTAPVLAPSFGKVQA